MIIILTICISLLKSLKFVKIVVLKIRINVVRMSFLLEISFRTISFSQSKMYVHTKCIFVVCWSYSISSFLDKRVDLVDLKPNHEDEYNRPERVGRHYGPTTD